MQRILGFLATQESALVAGERRLRAGDQAAVHPSRVAVRRSRSALRTFAPLFHAEALERLDDTLSAHAERLGAVRDLEVLEELFAGHPGLDPGLRGWVAHQLGDELSVAWGRLEVELAEHPPGLLQDHFAALLLATEPHDADLTVLCDRAARKARTRLARAGGDVELLHAARKACKRARYANEALGDEEGAAQFEAWQTRLGGHHDAHVAAAWLEQAPLPDALRPGADEVARELRLTAEADLGALVP